MPLLSVRDLTVRYAFQRSWLGGTKYGFNALDGVSFDLAEGETLGIVGESGCGKSTLGRAILRLIEPKSGHVSWRGEDLLAMNAKRLRQKRRDMQLIFQDPLASLDPRMNIEQIVAKPLKVHYPELSAKEVRDKIIEALEQVGLSENNLRKYPHEFSGGQCQRIVIARAIILKPKLLICDEPVSALDVSIQAQIINLLKRLQKELKLSLLFISHNLSVVQHISHRVMVLYLGKAVEIAPMSDFQSQPAHPYSEALISAIPAIHPKASSMLSASLLGGEIPSPIHPPGGCRFHPRCPKAQDICASNEPLLRQVGEARLSSCHFSAISVGSDGI